jgi:hypothetical protein
MTPTARFIASSFALALATATHATDVGVSISVSQPGVYGRIDIGRYPQPVLVQSQPILIQRGPRVIEPVYLWVPPGHQKNWRKHCGRYNACGVPVYFVQDDWYRERMERERYEHRDDRREERREDRGHGKHGKGHGKDRD